MPTWNLSCDLFLREDKNPDTEQSNATDGKKEVRQQLKEMSFKLSSLLIGLTGNDCGRELLQHYCNYDTFFNCVY